MLGRSAGIMLLVVSGGPCGAQDAARPPELSSASAASDPGAGYDAPPAAGSAKLKLASPPYPVEVRRALAWGRRQCRAQGGTAVAYAPGTVRTGDLTGDGLPDFVVDYRGTRCAGFLGLFNGTGGWDLEILVAKPRGRLVTVFSGRVRNYDVSGGPGPRTMTFDLHGGFCGLGGTDPCVKRRRIDGRRFAYRDR